MLVVGQAVLWAFMGVVLLLDVAVYGAGPTVGVQLVGMVGSSLVSTILMAPAALWMKLALPVRVSADGFSCPNGFGKMVTVSWDGILEVRSFNLPGLPYLLVKTDLSRLKLWLPQFVEKVEEFAGPDHVLYQALWPRVEK